MRLRAELAADLHERYGADSEPGAKPGPSDTAVWLVARDADGQAVGCGALRPLGDGVVEAKRMYVRPAARGRGVGRLVLAALEDAARGMGCGVIRLETGSRQPEAIALYTGHGYSEIPCFGAYAGAPQSRCFERRLQARAPDSPTRPGGAAAGAPPPPDGGGRPRPAR